MFSCSWTEQRNAFNFITSCPKKVFVQKMSGVRCGKGFQMLWNIWVVLLCNVVYFSVSICCTDTVSIVLYRLIQNLDHKSLNVAHVPFFNGNITVLFGTDL